MLRMPSADASDGASSVLTLPSRIRGSSRLMILCKLTEGELSVGELVEAIGLSQSALSQHLAKLRADRLVTTRRDAQTIYYRLTSAEASRVLEVLADIYCPPRRR
jgi:DNA-binding transcriptional ArsR family regulator